MELTLVWSIFFHSHYGDASALQVRWGLMFQKINCNFSPFEETGKKKSFTSKDSHGKRGSHEKRHSNSSGKSHCFKLSTIFLCYFVNNVSIFFSYFYHKTVNVDLKMILKNAQANICMYSGGNKYYIAWWFCQLAHLKWNWQSVIFSLSLQRKSRSGL